MESPVGIAMPESEFIVLVFAPATVGLVVMTVRRMSWVVYLASLAGVIASTLVGLGQYPLGADILVTGHLVFAVVLVVIPTVAAFGVGRLIALNLGGAYVFAASCTAYVFGLGMAAGMVGVSRFMAF